MKNERLGTMELISDTLNAQKEIEDCINTNGHANEHNYGYYQWIEEPPRKNVFIKFEKKRGILAQYSDNTKSWYFISTPIAKKEESIILMLESLDFLFKKKKAKKVMLELNSNLRKMLISAIKNSSLSIGQNNYVYHWPVFDMKNWNGYELKGKKWKKIRNIRNSFYKLNRVSVEDSRNVPSENLRKIVNDWLKQRSGIDRPMYRRYFNMVSQNFNGVDFARTLIVNEEPCSITAGWKIPNSNNYYSGVGIYNYKHKHIGEISNLDDLLFLKKKGFEEVDFGGSGKTLLQFKMKFNPSYIYKTYSFPVVRKN